MSEKGTILLVDDEAELLELLVDDFESEGFDCLSATNVSDALKIVSEKHPHTIISDINMPGMNGLQFLEEVRKMGLEIPFLFLTGFADMNKVMQALRLGAYDFLEKPHDRAHLKKLVADAVKLGIELQAVESELDELCANSGLKAEDVQQYRNIKKTLLTAEKFNRSQVKKSA